MSEPKKHHVTIIYGDGIGPEVVTSTRTLIDAACPNIVWETAEAGAEVFKKGIASGVPLSGIATRPGFMHKSPAGSMGGTFGATAVSAAAAVATLETIRDERLLENAAARGAQLSAGLRALQAEFPDRILDVRGRGCMVGLEFKAPIGSGVAGAVTAAAMDEGLLLLTTGLRETIRFIPPLIISAAEVDDALARFGTALRKAFAKM